MPPLPAYLRLPVCYDADWVFSFLARRALPPLETDRYAIPYFLGPHLDTRIECLPTCCGDTNPPRYPPITYDDYMTWWYDANYNVADQEDLRAEA